jgi:hypothetical protein
LEIEKPPPYVGDIWVPTLLIGFNGSMKNPYTWVGKMVSTCR